MEYSGAVMPDVNVYKNILVLTLLQDFNYFAAACEDLASRAQNALLCILKQL